METSHDIDHIKKEVKVYITVFSALAILTVVTVAVSYLHLPIGYAILLALFIATVKGTLVACYFMHLISERTLIYAILIFTVFNFFVLLFLPVLGFHDHLFGTVHVS